MTPGACCFVKDREGYGLALAVRDFDNDGVVDLAIGIPYARFTPVRGDVVTAAGAVHVLRGEPAKAWCLTVNSIWTKRRYRRRLPLGTTSCLVGRWPLDNSTG